MRIGGISVLGLSVLITLGCTRSKSDGPDAGAASGLISDLTSDLNLNAASGHVASTGSTGTWALDTGDCYSGDNDGYFGVFVKSKTDKRVWVKLVKDPTKGWTVAVSKPDTCKAGANGSEQCDVHYFDPSACSTLNIGLQAYTFKGKSSVGQHQFDGTATFDCSADKAHVSGTLKVDKCSP